MLASHYQEIKYNSFFFASFLEPSASLNSVHLSSIVFDKLQIVQGRPTSFIWKTLQKVENSVYRNLYSFGDSVVLVLTLAAVYM
jgi:hypothetical protein